MSTGSTKIAFSLAYFELFITGNIVVGTWAASAQFFFGQFFQKKKVLYVKFLENLIKM
jgi:hypothetical protein